MGERWEEGGKMEGDRELIYPHPCTLSRTHLLTH